MRSADIVDHTTLEKAEAVIIGAGAIGSNTALLLAKLGVGRLVIFDDDQVAEENIEPQFYRYDDVGRQKVNATSQRIADFAPDAQCILVPTRFDADTQVESSFIVSGVDSIESRKEIARSLMRQKDCWEYYIDARMGGNIIELFLVTPATIQEYWFALLKVEPLEIPCSAQSTSYNGMMAASMVARYIAALSMGQPVPRHQHIDLLAWSYTVSRLQ